MIPSLPTYVTLVFVLTTLLAIGMFLQAYRDIRPPGFGPKLITFLLPFWMLVTAILAMGGFYGQFGSLPPRVFTFAVLPGLLLILIYFIFFRSDFIERLSLRSLTLLHIVRVPVELVLLWLYQSGQVPEVMTFAGRNFDILSGLTAPVAFWLGFERSRPRTTVLVLWNIAALGLLLNIVITAVLSFPSPMQRFGLEQPNVGVTYFPFIWLPAIIVPIVLFSHLASLWQLFKTAGR